MAAAGEDRERTFRQIRLCQDFSNDQRAEGSEARRLQHKWAADGERGRDLVRREVQRKIEWRDKGAGADGHAFPHAPVALRARAPVERQDLAAEIDRRFGGYLESVNEA